MRKLLKEIDYALKHQSITKAKTLTNLGVASSPEKVDWQIYQALIYIKTNQLDLAIIFLQAALKKAIKIEVLYLQLGQLQQKNNSQESALATFHQGLQQFPLSISLLSHYIQCAKTLDLKQSKFLQQRAGLLLSLIEFNQLETLSSCHAILLETTNEIGAIWLKDEQIQGWLIDLNNIESSLSILIFSPKNNTEIIANQATPQLKKLGIGNGFNGFSFDIKDYVYQVDVVSKIKRTRLFGSPVATYSKHEKLAVPYLFKKNNTSKPQQTDLLIDIIIPVFNDLSTLKQCLKAISMANNFKSKAHIVIVNDCSPSESISLYLQQFEHSPKFTVINNTYNRGFIASVNIGMQQHPWRDVILLNSDTIVVNNWLDRIQALAYSDKEVATVTPLSNYAEKFSYPSPFKGNDLPLVKEIKNIDKIAAQVNKTEKIEVPTGNGFCFFIKRECLNQVGYFNQTDLLRGYSEESEFCLRASEKGWKHFCATNVYVGHEGGQSFKQERARLVYLNNERIKQKYLLYSESVYRFIADDPLKKSRKQIERAALKPKSCDELHVTDYYIANHPLFKEQLKSAIFMGKSVWVLTIAYKSFETYFQLYSVTQGLSNLEYSCSTGFSELMKDLKKFKLKQIKVHHSYYFPNSLNKIITQLEAPIKICPYDNFLQKKYSEILWIKYIQDTECISDYSASEYNDYPNYKIIKFPDNFYKSFYKKNYLAYIAIFSDITNDEQVELLRQIVEDWNVNNLPLSLVIVGNSNFKHGLESSQRIIFTSLNIEKSRELKNICSHVFILPNSSDFIPIDLSLALQHGFQIIAVSEPNIQEILSLQPTAITIEASDEPIAAIKKTFQNYAKKLS